MAYVETRERSPWPWVVLALALLAFIAVIVYLTRPAQQAPPEAGTTTTQPSGNTTIVQQDRDGSGAGVSAPANGTQPPSGTPGGNRPAASPAPGGTGESQAPANRPAGNATGETPANSTQAQQATPVDVQMGEWFVRLNPDTVPPGPVRFTVRNVGSATHGLEVEGQGVEQRGATIGPGESDTVTADLAPGEYEVYCFVGNHRERGMETTLRVRQP